MNSHKRFSRWLSAAGFLVFVSVTAPALGAGVELVHPLTLQEKPALIAPLKELVSIESGSTDLEGLDKMAQLIAGHLRTLGGRVEVIESGANVYRMHDTPQQLGKMVRATFAGTGTQWIPSTRAACWPSSPSASPATGPTAWASRTISGSL
jgi:hypothetical protein